MNTKVMAKFDIIGDHFSLEHVTNTLEIVPTETHIKGELTKHNLIRSNTCWRLSTGYEFSEDINDQLQKVLKVLNGKESKLAELKKDVINIEFMVVIVIKIFDNDKPAIYFDESTVQQVNDLGASIHFDYYIC
ncbi:DUF4279 domain-containing protein [Paenibacillaceae bacterium]|nr:DUF4279 domain-containing protein [Paenibacillaceae bacterium]